MSTYKAVAEIRINLNGGADPVLVKPGTIFEFDGMNATVTGWDGVTKTGAAPQLNKVIGDWIVPVEGTDTTPKAVVATSNKDDLARAQAVVDSSAIGSGNDIDLINKFEKRTPIIINDDASEVRKVSKIAGDTTTRNTSGVQMENSEVGKRAVVSHEERMVKQTQYAPNPTVDSSEPVRRKPVIIADNEGTVVKKVTEKAIFKNELKGDKVVEKSDISVEEGVVKETSYEESKPTDIGSTTQAQIAAREISGKKKAADAKAARMKQVVGDQDGVVVSKVRKDDSVKVTGDGFTSKLSVGKNDESDGKVTFGNGNANKGDIDGIIGGEAVVSGGGNINASDASADEATIIDNSGDVDIGDIIEGI